MQPGLDALEHRAGKVARGGGDERGPPRGIRARHPRVVGRQRPRRDELGEGEPGRLVDDEPAALQLDAQRLAQTAGRRDPGDAQGGRDELGCRADVDDVVLGPGEGPQGR